MTFQRRDIDDFELGQKVKLPEGEIGVVQSLDHDTNLVYVEVPVSRGVDVVDIDPSEPGLEILSDVP